MCFDVIMFSVLAQKQEECHNYKDSACTSFCHREANIIDDTVITLPWFKNIFLCVTGKLEAAPTLSVDALRAHPPYNNLRDTAEEICLKHFS